MAHLFISDASRVNQTSHKISPNLDYGFQRVDSSRVLLLRGGIPRPIGEFPGKFESSKLSRDNLSREIGRSESFPAEIFHGPALWGVPLFWECHRHPLKKALDQSPRTAEIPRSW